jgi:DNA-directed RNA polymerase II subunit RPB1
LNKKIEEIIKEKNEMIRKEKEGDDENVIYENIKMMKLNVDKIVENEMKGLKREMKKYANKIKQINQTIKGKEGSIRGKLMGKRVEL